MNKNGHPNIEYEKFYTDFHILHYIDINDIKTTIYNVFSKNPYLNLINVFKILINLDMSSEIDETFINLIKVFGIEDENVNDVAIRNPLLSRVQMTISVIIIIIVHHLMIGIMNQLIFGKIGKKVNLG